MSELLPLKVGNHERDVFNRQKNAAKVRGIAWQFTLATWLEVWAKSGKFADRGRGRGRYVMARFGDVGPYSPENVEIILFEKNALDSRLNHPKTLAQLSARELGNGRGWTFVAGKYQVSVAKKYIGRFVTEEQASAAYKAAAAARAASLNPNGGCAP